MLTRLLLAPAAVVAWLRAWWVDYLYAEGHDPDWPLRCSSRGCRDSAAPYMLPDGRVVIVCRDCLDDLLVTTTPTDRRAHP